MDTNNKLLTMDMQSKLSTLWIFMFLNVIFRDFHELGRPGFIEEMMTGIVNGVQITDVLLLQAGILLEIAILMVPLSRLLPYSINRWANIIVAVLTIVYVISAGQFDLDDYFFAAVEVIALMVIIWYAWKWPRPEGELSQQATLGQGNSLT